MRTMDRREFIKRIVVGGAVVGAATTLPSFAWSKKVTPNPSLVDTLQWVQESDARKIVSAYREGRATPEEALPALFSLLDPDNHGFSIIPREFGRLRDFQPKEISGEKIEGLDNLVQIREQYPDKFKETLTEMLKTGDSPDDIIRNGLPVKTFNPYVEALYWLALDGKVSDAESVVNEYLFSKLLIFAWGKPGDTKKEKQRYEERWGKFKIVMDRLNTPVGLDSYVDMYIDYRSGYAQWPRTTFKVKKGQCTCLSYFGKYALDRAGYKTFMRSVRWGPDDWNDVHMGAGVPLKEGYLLVIDFNRIANTISGPYKTPDELDMRLSRGRKVTESKWGAMYPPR